MCFLPTPFLSQTFFGILNFRWTKREEIDNVLLLRMHQGQILISFKSSAEFYTNFSTREKGMGIF